MQVRGGREVKILDILFGCWHKRLSFPMSSKPGERRVSAACKTGAYVVCLDCGREFAYDWQTMRRVSSGPESRVHPPLEVEVNS
jgi:hypothetical protein